MIAYIKMIVAAIIGIFACNIYINDYNVAYPFDTVAGEYYI